MSEDQHMPKWALDPLLTESSPLQSGARGDSHGAVNGGGAADREPDSEGDYDSDFSDEDLGRVRGLRVSTSKYLSTHTTTRYDQRCFSGTQLRGVHGRADDLSILVFGT